MLYPGMVHFIFIDRSFDEMTTPSVHCDQPMVSINRHIRNTVCTYKVFFSSSVIWTGLQLRKVSQVEKYLKRRYKPPQPIQPLCFLNACCVWVSYGRALGTRLYHTSWIQVATSVKAVHWHTHHLQIWEMVKRCRRYLSQGYTSQTWLDHHFLYSYYVWVNHHSASGHNDSRRYSSPTVNTSAEGCTPGIIGSHFYRYTYTITLTQPLLYCK